MHQLVLLRHGESTWNKENRFTGWTDVDLTDKGKSEAAEAGRVLKSEGFRFDEAHTSVLKRAIRTLWIALDEMDAMWIPVQRSWRLNERHYGALQGLNKAETAARHGEEKVKVWRRSYDVPPPAVETDDERHPRRDPRYAGLADDEVPRSESLKDTVARVLPYWNESILPRVLNGKTLLIAAHGNSLRALVMYLDGLSPKEVLDLNIPTGLPLTYRLDGRGKALERAYLGDPAAVEAAMAKVAAQGKAR